MSTTRKKKMAGVTFPPAILQYLDTLCQEEDLNRSQLITKMVRYYAEQHGTPIQLTAGGGELPEATSDSLQNTLF